MASHLDCFSLGLIQIVTNDGRVIVGALRGFDQSINVVLEDCHERIFSSTSGVELSPLGLYVVRGDNVAIVGLVDESRELDLSNLMCEPLKPVVH